MMKLSKFLLVVFAASLIMPFSAAAKPNHFVGKPNHFKAKVLNKPPAHAPAWGRRNNWGKMSKAEKEFRRDDFKSENKRYRDRNRDMLLNTIRSWF